MDVYKKIEQLVHAGNEEEVKVFISNLQHADAVSVKLHCLGSAIVCKNYEVVEYCIGQIPSQTNTVHLFKLSIRNQDHKMVDILLRNTPNRFTCSEAVLEAIEHNDLTTIQKLFNLCTFQLEPLRFLLHAGKHGSLNSLKYLLSKKPQEDTTMQVLLRQPLPPQSIEKGIEILDTTMEYCSTHLLKKTARNYAGYSSNSYVQRLCDYSEARSQHQAINSALTNQGLKTVRRKI